MKMKSIFLAAAAALTLASCAKDEPATTGNDNEKTNFVVALPDAPSTYAVETPQGEGQIVPNYQNVTVYLVDGGDNVTAHAWTSAEISAKQKRFEQIKEPAKVIVVVNKGSAALPTSGETTLAALNNALKTLTIADQNRIVSNYLTVQNVTLYGEVAKANFGAGAAHEGHTVKTANVSLKALVSRFEVGRVKAGTGLTALEVENVYINYFYTTYAKTGTQSFIETNWPGTFTPAWATDAVNADVTSNSGTKAYAYQLFAGMVPHIIYKVRGTVASGYKLSDGTTGTFTGKYITVKGFKVGTTSLTTTEPHKIYKMGLTGGGIEINAGDIDPKPEMGRVDLIVAISVENWKVENVTPEI